MGGCKTPLFGDIPTPHPSFALTLNRIYLKFII